MKGIGTTKINSYGTGLQLHFQTRYLLRFILSQFRLEYRHKGNHACLESRPNALYGHTYTALVPILLVPLFSLDQGTTLALFLKATQMHLNHLLALSTAVCLTCLFFYRSATNINIPSSISRTYTYLRFLDCGRRWISSYSGWMAPS